MRHTENPCIFMLNLLYAFASFLGLPLQVSVVTYAVVLLIILLAPVVMGKLRVPSVIGLILAGVALVRMALT